ncbi:MAG: Cell division protein FtsX [Candidatus Celerinatantimonas neptuna]|nr:MAG: Cell division protein FtsX [Candidatus Celerinatantimonas neptuna]
MNFGASQRSKRPRKLSGFGIRHLQQGTASLGEIWRTPTSSMMTIAVIGVCLALLVTFHLAIKNVRDAAPSWQKSAQINVFVSSGTNEMERTQLEDQIRQINGVSQVRLIDKAQGLAEFKQDSGFGNALDLLGENPLPDLLIVTPELSQQEQGQLQLLQSKLNQLPHVGQVRLNLEWVKQLSGILNVVNQSVRLLIGLLLISIILTIGNTIRLNVLSQKDEIEVMKLVGATNAFIQRPFLYTGFWYGFIGGLLAWILSNILMLWLGSAVGDLANLYQQSIYLEGLSFSGFLTLMGFSSLLGLMSSWFSVNHYVKKIEPR